MGQVRLRESLSTHILKKRIDHGCQKGSMPSFSPLPPTQMIVGVGHMIIAYLLGDVSGMCGVFSR